MIRAYDATALSAFRRCPELFRSTYLLHLRKAALREAPLAGGQAWHAALEVWFSKPTSDIDAAVAALRDAWGPEPLIPDPGEKRPLALYERTLQAYCERWPREKDDFVVTRNERWEQAEFDWPKIMLLIGKTPPTERGFAYGAIFDRDVQYADGATVPMDSKTTSGWLNEGFFTPFALSLQIRGQVAIKRVLGEPCEAALIDAVHLNTRGPKIDMQKDFARQLVRFEDWQIDAWARDVEATVREIQRLRQERGVEQRWPQNEQSCFAWNRPCPMLARCLTHPDLAESVEGFEVRPWEPWNLRDKEQAE